MKNNYWVNYYNSKQWLNYTTQELRKIFNNKFYDCLENGVANIEEKAKIFEPLAAVIWKENFLNKTVCKWKYNSATRQHVLIRMTAELFIKDINKPYGDINRAPNVDASDFFINIMLNDIKKSYEIT